MKKLVLLILALCALAGCGGAEEPVESMTGTVLELSNGSMLLCIQSGGYPEGAECRVPLPEGMEEEPGAGDEVLVRYTGGIAESDPMQLTGEVLEVSPAE